MKKIQVTVETEKDWLDLEIPVDVPAQDLVPVLGPLIGQEGNDLEFCLPFDDWYLVERKLTLAEVGVCDGAQIRVVKNSRTLPAPILLKTTGGVSSIDEAAPLSFAMNVIDED